MWLQNKSYYIAILFSILYGTFQYLFNGPLQTSIDYNLVNVLKEDGYTSEVHPVVTEDGYVLTIFRVQPKESKSINFKRPLLMMHGVMQNPGSWIDAGPGASLAYLLAEEGYDVWLGTVRGTRYAQKHIHLKPTEPEFWLFSLDDMALNDLPAQFNYILNFTNSERLDYIGFSQGCILPLILISEKPEFSDKIQQQIALAPPSRLLNSKSPVLKMITNTVLFLSKTGYYDNGLGVLGDSSIIKKLQEYPCSAGFKSFCEAFVSMVDSFHPGSIADETLRKLFINFPDSTSFHTFLKYGRTKKSGQFLKVNRETGNTEEICLKNITSEIFIINGLNDHMVDANDSLWLNDQLPNSKIHILENPLWNHFDMMYSQHIRTQLLPLVKEYLENKTVL